MIPLLEQVAQSGRPLVVIAEDSRGRSARDDGREPLRGAFPCVAVKAPGFGDRRKAMLETSPPSPARNAIMEATGATLEASTLKDLGTAKKVVVDKDNDDRSSKARARRTRSRAASRRSRPRSRHEERLRQGEAPGAPREALRAVSRRSTSARRPKPR
jgi:chaperonin GroEL